MSDNVTEPVDDLHAQCVEARWTIRAHARILQDAAARWEPRPCPDEEES